MLLASALHQWRRAAYRRVMPPAVSAAPWNTPLPLMVIACHDRLMLHVACGSQHAIVSIVKADCAAEAAPSGGTSDFLYRLPLQDHSRAVLALSIGPAVHLLVPPEAGAIAPANRIAAAPALSLPERIHVTFPKVPWDQPATLIVSAWRGMAS
jgi:hypothetical protein